MMKTCACFHTSSYSSSLPLLPSTIQFQQQRFHHFLNFPFRSLSSSILSLHATPREIELHLSSSNDTVLSQNPTTVYDTPPQLEESPPPSPLVLSGDDNKTTNNKLKKKKNQNDDNTTNFDDRFKLRNGKEVTDFHFSISISYYSILFLLFALFFRFLKRKLIWLVLSEKVM